MKILQCICTATLLGMMACTNSDQMGLDVDDVQSTSRLQLTASQRGLAGSVTSRAADNLYTPTTGFDGNESVEVWFNNTHVTYTVGTPDANHKSVLSSNDEQRYPGGSGTVPMWAVYPAASGTNGSHTVVYDQTSNANYKASDLMYARKNVDLAYKTVAQNLAFEHQLIKLKMVVTKDAALSNITKIEIKNVKRTVAITPASDALTQGTLSQSTDGYGNNLLVMSGTISDTSPHTYCVVFPAQTWDGTDFLEITMANSQTYIFTLDKNDWQNGSEYVLNLAVYDSYLGAKVSVTDWLTCGEVPVVDTGDTSGN